MKFHDRTRFRIFIAIFLFMIILSSMDIKAQQTSLLNGKNYVRSAGKWYQVERGTNFEVVDSIITVKWKSSTTSSAIDVLNNSQGAVVWGRNMLGFVHLKIAIPGDVLQIIQNYLNSGLIDVAEADTYVQWGAVANDSLLSDQWYIDKIQAKEAWDITTGDTSIVVSILDSGLDFNHEDLGMGTDSYQNVWQNPGEIGLDSLGRDKRSNGVDDDNNGYIDDYQGWDFLFNDNNIKDTVGHGTLDAGLIIAKTNNSTGIAGVAGGWHHRGSKVMCLKFSSTYGSPDAIIYAANNGAKIINMSFKSTQTQAMDSALQYAYNKGCLLVACAGNCDPTLPPASVWYPARAAHVMAISGTDSNDHRWCDTAGRTGASNEGPQLSVAAPAQDILSTARIVQGYPHYLKGSGTSASAPLVCGLAALMLSVNPTLAHDSIRSILQSTAEDLGSPGFDNVFGWGRVNALNAVKEAGCRAGSLLTPALNSPANASITSNSVTLTWNSISRAEAYHLQLSTDSSFSTITKDTTKIKTTSCSISGLSCHTKYYWRVNSILDTMNTGGSIPCLQIRSFTVDTPQAAILSYPYNNATGVSSPTTLGWNAAQGATTYDLQLARDSTFTNIMYDTTSITATSCIISGLSASTNYWWHVKSSDSCGTSSWSQTRKFTTNCLPPAPQLTGTTQKGTCNGGTVCYHPKLTWTTNSCAVRYDLYRYFDDGCGNVSPEVIYSALASSYIDTTIATGHEDCYVYYFVKAISNINQRDSTSNTVQFQTNILSKPGYTIGEKNSIPSEYILMDNYPNPFNPITRLDYGIPEDTRVTLKIYNVLGQVVARLVDAFQTAGYKSVEFNAGNLSSGVYFYRLEAGRFMDVKKMLFAR